MALLASVTLLGNAGVAATRPDSGQSAGAAPESPFDPIDPQHWQDQQDMTWADYHHVPGTDWANPDRQPTKQKLRIAVVAVDFPDQPFVMTEPKKSDDFGNPQIDPVKRDQIAQFYADFYGKPSTLNHEHTVNEYWMEQTNGRIGVEFVPVGEYRAPRPSYEYGLNDIGQEKAGCPSGHTCDGTIEHDVDPMWKKDVGDEKFDRVLRVYAGYDETSVWQEFGPMKFQTKDDVPDEWGPPDPALPNAVRSRYTDFTSWKAGSQLWGNSGIRQGESSGTITHEISHTFDIGDNNNNPYAEPYHRAGTGPFDLMDRGSFNGPGGPHMRWVVPATQGAAMPAGQTVRTKTKLGFVDDGQILHLSKDALRTSGLAVFDVKARSAKPGKGDILGVQVDFGTDRTPACDIGKDPLCSGPGFTDYTIETVQRIGADSFTPDHGVMLTKNKPFGDEDDSCGYLCFSWMIDANPQDIHKVDYYEPNGTPVMRSIGDYRQLNDGLFHAGTHSGSAYEYVDQANRLHFYVVGKHMDAGGELVYTVAVQSLDGAGASRHGVALSRGKEAGAGKGMGTCRFGLTNTGRYRDDGAQPADTRASLHSDVYRLTADVKGDGWRASLPNELATARFAGGAGVDVAVAAAGGASRTGQVTLTATSVSDPSRSATSTCTVTR
ncbi:peptidase M6 [Streptomyces sp. TS71-3]|uniref:peptidase M6 n=1 Tax=Streptomyces sp. TS71-3 TaxID=2733862 RepID=UPI001BB3ACAF|nr:peptidase M6 [Streptomyces sp. TS71-3]